MVKTVPPCVLIISGNDPSGGAGMAADIQAVSALGGHPAPVLTSLTVQDTSNAYRVSPVDPELVTEQAATVLADLPVRAVKIGLLATAEIGTAVASLLAEHGNLPVVLDPVLVAAGGADLAERALEKVIVEQLVPLATLVTPNALELTRLAGSQAEDRESRARALLSSGCDWVLAKGADEDTVGVENVLFGRSGFVESFRWTRLPGQYHGSGCTLAAALATMIAKSVPVPRAVADAQRYTDFALRHAFRPGRGQHIPGRMAQPSDVRRS
ncbi:MAG: hydroxymethylpyrimidine/phosphomethylpyrimidine kinase [Gammaproteobacteria bacterium]|nr:MAG: hydroxymethylpyrimidine/phosphomethylpyrimidine kinase [Gammaproteobacteria bacterium]